MNEQLKIQITEFVLKYTAYFKLYMDRCVYGIQMDLWDHTLRGCYGGAYTSGGYYYCINVKNDTAVLEYIRVNDKNEISFALRSLEDNHPYGYSVGIDELLEPDYELLLARLFLMLENKHVTEYAYDDSIFCNGIVQKRICCNELNARGFINVIPPQFGLRGKMWVKIKRNGYTASNYNYSNQAIEFSKNCLDNFMITDHYTPTYEYLHLKK